MLQGTPMPRAILVEDDTALAHLTRAALTRLGFDSIEGDDLTTGFGILVQWSKAPPPDLLVVDICLPAFALDGREIEMDGIEVLKAVRQARTERDWWPEDHVPAIVVTSGVYKPHNGVAQTIRDHRAVFLPKPYTEAQLAEAVEAARRAAVEWDTLDDIEPVVDPDDDLVSISA